MEPDWVDDAEFASWLIPEEGISHPLRLVSSSAISYVGYDQPYQILYVHLLAGGGYAYGDVPIGVYYDFLAAPSKGKFFNKVIKGTSDDPEYPGYSLLHW